ncbi:MAG: outer membrane beta-barrel protein [Bacteroidales bacterium]
MRKTGIIILMSGIIMQAFSQQVISGENEKKQVSPSEITNVSIGDSLISIQDDKESLRIRIANRGIEILESLEGKPRIKFEKYDKNYVDDNEGGIYSQYEETKNHAKKRHRIFKGHWAGIEIGFNNLLSDDYSFVLPDDIDYMTLHSGKSTCFNLNFAQQSLGFTRRVGLVTGLGLNWNNYHFDGNNNIVKGSDGRIVMLDPGEPLKKSKFTTVYLTLPVMLEIQIPTDSKQINLSGGVIGAVKLGSHSKMVYENGDRVKSDDDFSLNMLRYGVTARAGFENINLYATYYPVSLFKSGKGPGGYSLYPFEIGFAFTIND